MSDQPIPLFEPADKNEVAKESFKQFAFETLKIIIISLIIILPVRYYLVQPFYVKGQSMEPNFHDNEYLIINEIGYRLNLPERGDIIVFKYPKNPSEFYIKRIIGLPGEKIEIKDNKIYINDLILNETYLIENTSGSININLQEDEYFVLGDNRDASSDSRSWGILDKSLIIGRVWLRLLPLSKIDKFNAPSYY